jgi:hypothetical protein
MLGPALPRRDPIMRFRIVRSGESPMLLGARNLDQ